MYSRSLEYANGTGHVQWCDGKWLQNDGSTEAPTPGSPLRLSTDGATAAPAQSSGASITAPKPLVLYFYSGLWRLSPRAVNPG